jgi:stage II sporulation protein P
MGLVFMAALAVFGLYRASNSAFLAALGERAAVMSAAIQMPDGAAALLRERFRAEIYNPEEEAAPDAPEGVPLPPEPAEPTEPSLPSQEESSSPAAPPPPKAIPRIPEEYAAPVISEDFSARTNPLLLRYGEGLIRNETQWDDEEINAVLEEPHKLRFEGAGEPEVLILHTHATEAFETYDSPAYDTRNTWRSTDNRANMAAVGDAFAQVLEANGVGVIHDTTQHDSPSYNGAYERSAVTIAEYLERYPSIKVVLDVHRDAMQRDDAIVKPVAVIGGEKAAQVMIIAACDDGAMGVPEWRENLRFAAAYQDAMERDYPGLTRPVFFCYRKYNMDLTTGSLLLEFGSNANTLEEAIYSARLSATALVGLMGENWVGEK